MCMCVRVYVCVCVCVHECVFVCMCIVSLCVQKVHSGFCSTIIHILDLSGTHLTTVASYEKIYLHVLSLALRLSLSLSLTHTYPHIHAPEAYTLGLTSRIPPPSPSSLSRFLLPAPLSFVRGDWRGECVHAEPVRW